MQVWVGLTCSIAMRGSAATKCGWGSDNEACSLVVGGVSAATKVGGAQISKLVANK